MSAKAKGKPAMGWLVVALALGMLIWVRLRLVTDIPRSAYADPQRQSEPAGTPAAQPGESERGGASESEPARDRVASGEQSGQ